MNVFQYSAVEDMRFKAMAKEIGYKPTSTFFSDLSIAEFCQMNMLDSNAVKCTAEDITRNYLNDYKMYTEFILCLNWKIWEHNEKNPALATIYNELWQSCEQSFFDYYADNEEAISYYYNVTD